MKKEHEEFQKFLNESKREIQQMSESQDKFLKEAREVFKDFMHKLVSHDKRLKKLTEINSYVEDTLGNVLLAIRQNEYLQAWYPEQKGHPEMNVVGRHPTQEIREV